ncbi:hypothetical protein PPO43_00705 [Saprospira sp. CCB-QB6]|uniref:tetratricopeptide repeat protein n=1 Tax=Saprospira sp. CCB-QB6 TaxID=3023936 RepID=UPI0023490047|nr:hypothetical protein [Saprospira sp. CCB-QB6]WCL81615.1 hypothetical protein PPO43_00705 [Saprospira sp. CCB-QB6]
MKENNKDLLLKLFRADELDACQELAEQLMKKSPKTAAAYFYWTKVELEKESPDYLSAKRYLQVGLKQEIEKDSLYFMFAQLMEEEGRYDLALHYYGQAKDYEEAQLAEAKLLFLLEENIPRAKFLLENIANPTTEVHYFLAAIAVHEAEFTLAIKLLLPICESNFNEDYFDLLCRAYLAVGKGEKALPYLKVLTEKAFYGVGYMQQYAQLLQDLKKDLAAAKAWLAYHTSLQVPQRSEDQILLEKALDFYALGMHEGALFFCEQANQYQLSIEGLRMQTQLYKATGAIDKMEACLQQMIQIYPEMDIAAFTTGIERSNPEDSFS